MSKCNEANLHNNPSTYLHLAKTMRTASTENGTFINKHEALRMTTSFCVRGIFMAMHKILDDHNMNSDIYASADKMLSEMRRRTNIVIPELLPSVVQFLNEWESGESDYWGDLPENIPETLTQVLKELIDMSTPTTAVTSTAESTSISLSPRIEVCAKQVGADCYAFCEDDVSEHYKIYDYATKEYIGEAIITVSTAAMTMFTGNIEVRIAPEHRQKGYGQKAFELMSRILASAGQKIAFISCIATDTPTLTVINRMNTEFVATLQAPEQFNNTALEGELLSIYKMILN